MDFYTEARKLARELQDIHLQEGRDIIEEIETGSTGTEILMGLRWHLKQVLGKSQLPSEIRTKCEELITKVDTYLR